MRTLLACLTLLVSACSTMTSVVMLDPGKQYAPTQSVLILLTPPSTPYTEIAKLESRGLPGEAETLLLQDAREKAREIGADAIILVDTQSVYQPALLVYDPWPPFSPWYSDRWHGRGYGYFGWFFPYGPQLHSWPGGYAYTVRAIAIKFD